MWFISNLGSALLGIGLSSIGLMISELVGCSPFVGGGSGLAISVGLILLKWEIIDSIKKN